MADFPEAARPALDREAATSRGTRLPSSARSVLYAAIRRRLRWDNEEDVEDLVSEGILRYIRRARRETIDNPEALLATIGNGVALDWIGRRVRWRKIMAPLGPDEVESTADHAASPDMFEDPVRRTIQVVELFFSQNDERCGVLFRFHINGVPWSDVAEKQSRSHDAVRKQWSRCVQMLRTALEDEPEFKPLKEWYG